MFVLKLMTKRLIAVTALALLLTVSISSKDSGVQQGASEGSIPRLVNQIKKTVVFLGQIDEKGTRSFKATGFLISVGNTIHLVTAKHVVVDLETGNLKDQDLHAFFNLKDGGIVRSSIAEMKAHLKVRWIFHENAGVDVAVMPFGVDPRKHDVRVMPDSLFLHSNKLFELYDVFFLCYQPGTEGEGRISPVMRNGMISRVNVDRTLYIDGFAFPGNSGSPVFLRPLPIRFDEHADSCDTDPLGGRLIGIIGQYLPYQQIAIMTPTSRPRVIFQENTGLSKAWSVQFIEEIFESDAFKEQLNTIREK